jgi:hypothetical protein
MSHTIPVMQPEHIIEKVIIDIEHRIITIEDNGELIPTQKYQFEDEDEWFDIKDRTGEVVLAGNIWFDEEWGFQFAGYEKVGEGEDRHTQIASNYMNPGEMTFVDEGWLIKD